MKATITIKDELSFSFGDAVEYSMTLDFPSKFVSPREIIRERVFREVQSYNEKTPEIFNGLVQPTGAERTFNGFKMRERKKMMPSSNINKRLRHLSEMVLLCSLTIFKLKRSTNKSKSNRIWKFSFLNLSRLSEDKIICSQKPSIYSVISFQRNLTCCRFSNPKKPKNLLSIFVMTTKALV
jgi:hypothetical protein